MDIKGIIKLRKACRTYNQEFLKQSDREALEEFIKKNSIGIGGDIINISIIEKRAGEKKMKLAYGAIKGNNTYLLGTTENSPKARINYGYIMEKVVLKATELGLASCWIGYFDHEYFNDLTIENGLVIPGLVIIGYAAEKSSLPERFMRYAVSASKRLPWDKLFFDYRTKAAISSDLSMQTSKTSVSYSESLEMLRLAPSSSNSQPWRVYFDGVTDEFHFFKKPKNRIYESMGMHELDLGIAMAHFELTSLHNGLSGKWINHSVNELTSGEELQYIISWKCE